MYSLIDVNLYWVNLYWLTGWGKGNKWEFQGRRLGTPYVIEIMFAFSPRTPFPFFLALLCFAIAERNRVSLKERSAPPPFSLQADLSEAGKRAPSKSSKACKPQLSLLHRPLRSSVCGHAVASLSLSLWDRRRWKKKRARKKEEGRRKRNAGRLPQSLLKSRIRFDSDSEEDSAKSR